MKPEFTDVDAWGLSHRGKVREANGDHFFAGSLCPEGFAVDSASFPLEGAVDSPSERLASLGIVADGVGSKKGGEEAARAAVEALVHEVSRSFHSAERVEDSDPDVFSRLLHDAALSCHESLLQHAEREPELGPFATTLTLFLGLWPHAYLLQVGDSRCYVYQDDHLSQITRDQTWAQELVDAGALSQTRAQESRWADVLSSAIGGTTAAPVVTRMVRKWGAVVLLCSDGLIKHVSDERIAERIETMTGARQLCEALLQDALDGGGSDNITIIAGRTVGSKDGVAETTTSKPEQSSGVSDASDDDSVRKSVASALAPEFEVLRSLGNGRTSHVFLAREPGLERLVAVKVLRAEAGNTERIRLRFEQEARLAATVRHPLVPEVHGVGRLPSGLPYIVNEFIEGRTLRDMLVASGEMPPSEVRRVLADLAEALAASHEKGVIHRNVGPSNVIIEAKTGRAFLTDFGLSAARAGGESSPKITQTGEVIGDPMYVSPEQLKGEPVTAQSDIYSIGVLGYELLTCTNPFGSSPGEDLLVAHLRGEPADLPWEVSAKDPELGGLLRRCLSKQPSRRPTAGEVRAALVGGAAGASPSSRGHGSASPLLAAFPRIDALLFELRRRRVYHVAAGYLVSAYVALEGTDLLLEGTASEPDWLYPGIVILVLAGFPVAVVLGWIFDLTRSGIQRTEAVPTSTGRPLRIAGLILAVAIAVFGGWLILR